jgi:hypothetical protein
MTPAFLTEAALLLDPLGPRIEVVDAKAHPVHTTGTQREVDNWPGVLGFVALTEDLRSC